MMLQKKVKAAVIDAVWKQVAAQSERQLGAFIFLYTLHFERGPNLLHSKYITFRNDVVHKGRIPTRSEALDYGEAVLSVLGPILVEVQKEFPDGVRSTVFQQITGSRDPGDAGLHVATMSMPTIISLTNAGSRDGSPSLEKSILGLPRWA
jgi:hypothetical protein